MTKKRLFYQSSLPRAKRFFQIESTVSFLWQRQSGDPEFFAGRGQNLKKGLTESPCAWHPFLAQNSESDD